MLEILIHGTHIDDQNENRVFPAGANLTNCANEILIRYTSINMKNRSKHRHFLSPECEALVLPDASREKRDASREKRDASREKRDASREKRDASREKRDASREKRDASREKRDASREKRDASRKKRDASCFSRDASHEKRDASRETVVTYF